MKRYFEREPRICIENTELGFLLPTAAEEIELHQISSILTKFESVG